MIIERFYRIRKNRYNTTNTNLTIEDLGIGLFFEIMQSDPNTKEQFKEYLPKTETFLFYGDLNYGFIDENRAFIGNQYDNERQEVELDRTHLLELINKWEDLSNRDAKEIIVRRDGERFEIEGVFE
jgi:hypothetical protein